jgi:hypothetical protein
MAYGYVSVGNTPTLILDANPQRLSVIIINSGSDRLHFAQDASVTTASPYLLKDGSLTEDSGGTKMYCGPFYGISTGGTAVVYYWERTR